MLFTHSPTERAFLSTQHWTDYGEKPIFIVALTGRSPIHLRTQSSYANGN